MFRFFESTEESRRGAIALLHHVNQRLRLEQDRRRRLLFAACLIRREQPRNETHPVFRLGLSCCRCFFCLARYVSLRDGRRDDHEKRMSCHGSQPSQTGLEGDEM